MKPFELSASRLKKFLQCPRSYYLHHVARVDQDPGGKYLEIGNAYDGHVEWYVTEGKRGVRNIDPKILGMFAAAKPNLPAPGTVTTQHQYRIDAGGFVVTGKADFRRRGWVGDAKTTSDRGRGRGKDAHTPPRALDPETLQNDVQSLLYAWCEFQLDPSLVTCQLVWTYVTKESKPTSWNVHASVARPFVEPWFAQVVRPAAAAMAALHALPTADQATANLESCAWCWVKAHCNPYVGPNTYSTEEVAGSVDLIRLRVKEPSNDGNNGSMAFNLDDLGLVEKLEQSIAAVQSEHADDALPYMTAAVPAGVVHDLGEDAPAINPPRAKRPAAPPPEPVPSGVIIDLSTVSTKDLAAELLRRVS